MTHWRTLTDARYVTHADLDPNADTIVKIVRTQGGVVEGENGRKARKPFLWFAGRGGAVAFPDGDGKPRPFAPSNTDCKTLQSLSGSPDIERWVGMVVALYLTTTKLAGKTVPCVRIRPKLPDVGGKPGGMQPSNVPGDHPHAKVEREPGSDDQ